MAENNDDQRPEIAKLVSGGMDGDAPASDDPDATTQDGEFQKGAICFGSEDEPRAFTAAREAGAEFKQRAICWRPDESEPPPMNSPDADNNDVAADADTDVAADLDSPPPSAPKA